MQYEGFLKEVTLIKYSTVPVWRGIIKSNENVKVVIIQIPTCTRIEPQMLHNAMFTTITCQKTFCEGSCWVWINHSHLTSLVKVHMEQRLGNCVWPSWKNISKFPLATFLKELRCQIFDVWMIHYFFGIKVKLWFN